MRSDCASPACVWRNGKVTECDVPYACIARYGTRHANQRRARDGNGIGPLQLRGELNTEPLLQGRERPLQMSPSEFRAARSTENNRGVTRGFTTARACIGLRGGGEHDNGSTPQPVSGTVGASVLENTMTVHLVALPPPIHLTGRSAIPTARTCAQGDKDTSVGVMRCVGLRTAGLRGGYALHGTHSHFGAWGSSCIAWDSLTHHP